MEVNLPKWKICIQSPCRILKLSGSVPPTMALLGACDWMYVYTFRNITLLLQYVATNARRIRWFGSYRHQNMILLAYVFDVVAKLATTICRALVALNSTLRFIPFISIISYKSIMSSESSFDGQTFNEFDDFLPKPLSTDSDSDHVDSEPTGATTSSQAPLTSVPASSQTSMFPSTPGISESFFSLEISPVQSTLYASSETYGSPSQTDIRQKTHCWHI